MAGTSLGGGTRIFTPAGAGAWSVIEDFEVTDEFGQQIKTFDFAAIDFDDVSMLVLVADLSLTAASGAYDLQINGITSNYFTNGRRIVNGVETIINVDGQGTYEIASASLATGLDKPIHAICYIQLNKTDPSGQRNAGFQSFANGTNTDGSENKTGSQTSSIASISSIRISGRIRNFSQGSRFTLYKVSR